jgi:hypothetical protein
VWRHLVAATLVLDALGCSGNPDPCAPAVCTPVSPRRDAGVIQEPDAAPQDAGVIGADTGASLDPPTLTILASPAALLLHPGDSAPTTVLVQHGAHEVVTVSVDPPVPGVDVAALTLDGSTSTGQLVLRAQANAPAGTTSTGIHATAGTRSASTPLRVVVLPSPAGVVDGG